METTLAGYRLRRLLAGAAAGLLTLAILGVTSTAAAADPAIRETVVEMFIPVTVTAPNECTGETVVLQGHLFLRTHLTLNGTHLTISEQTNTQGVTGVDPITGAKYVSNDVDTFTATVQKSTSAMGHQSWLFSRSGESWPGPDDFYLHSLIHFSWNAAGEVTTDIDNFSTDCR